MASLHELREVPVQGDYFLLFDDLLKVIRDASIKHKFSFKTPHKDLKRARYRCANTERPWKVNAHRNPENNNEIIVDEVTITRLHTIALRVEEEGTSLGYVRGLTNKGSGDDEVANSYN